MIASFFDHYTDLLGTKPMLLAVSGGRDSVLLAHLVHLTGRPFAIAHCNFHLRPGDCDRDEAFVRQLAQRYGVPFHVAQFSTHDFAATHHLSIEQAARQQRYEFFAQLIATHDYSCLLTGHHADDSIETFFLNLLRGTGVSGLRGIQPCAPLPYSHGCAQVLRPLLSLTRQQVDDLVQHYQLAYVEDSTNATLDYRRNQVRHQLLPVLRQMSPHFDATMQSNLAALAGAEQVLNHRVQGLIERFHLSSSANDWFLHYETISEFEAPSTILFEMLQPYGFNFAQVTDMLSGPRRQVGKTFVSATHRLVFDRNGMFLQPLEIEVSEPTLERTLHVPAEFDTFQVPPHQLLLDADLVLEPLTLRHPQPSDRIQPYGMRGASQLVSDLLKNHRVSPVFKSRQWLLVDAQGRILWVLGHRASIHAAVTPSTQHILKLTALSFEHKKEG